MFVGFVTWWYGDGLSARINGAGERLARVNDFFSVGLLLKTLFTPFRQLSIGPVRGPLEVRIRAFFDDLLSRMIGGAIRTTMIGVAGLVWVGSIVYGIVVIAGWLVLPVLPAIGLGLAVTGVIVGGVR